MFRQASALHSAREKTVFHRRNERGYGVKTIATYEKHMWLSCQRGYGGETSVAILLLSPRKKQRNKDALNKYKLYMNTDSILLEMWTIYQMNFFFMRYKHDYDISHRKNIGLLLFEVLAELTIERKPFLNFSKELSLFQRT